MDTKVNEFGASSLEGGGLLLENAARLVGRALGHAEVVRLAAWMIVVGQVSIEELSVAIGQLTAGEDW